MLNLHLAQNSLLYGESLLWLLISPLAPFYWMPKLEETRQHHIVQDLAYSRRIIQLHDKLVRSRFIRHVWPKVIAVTQVAYLLLYVVVGIAFQRRVLESLGVFQTDSLSYKTLYYSPTLFRIGLLVITLSALAHMRYNTWVLYDQSAFFTVDKPFQCRAALLGILSILPDCIFNMSETFIVLRLIRSSELVRRAGSWPAPFEVFVYLLFIGLSSVNVIVRYKPVLDLMYLSACVRKHLAALSQQLEVPAERLWLGRGNRATTANRLPGHAPVVRLTNVQELERHLTQVSLLVGRVDREAPATVLSLTLSNTAGFCYVILYTIRVSSSLSATSFLSIISLVARSVPIVALFLLGQALETQCRRLLNKLEAVYLEQESASLLYKQMLDTQYSLERVFRLIEGIRFTCDGLMKVNSSTLFTCAIYVGGCVFVVLQYDLIEIA